MNLIPMFSIDVTLCLALIFFIFLLLSFLGGAESASDLYYSYNKIDSPSLIVGNLDFTFRFKLFTTLATCSNVDNPEYRVLHVHKFYIVQYSVITAIIHS